MSLAFARLPTLHSMAASWPAGTGGVWCVGSWMAASWPAGTGGVCRVGSWVGVGWVTIGGGFCLLVRSSSNACLILGRIGMGFRASLKV